MSYMDFFTYLGFDFNADLKSRAIDIEETTLSYKLKNSVYFYKSPNNTNTSFYLITSSLEDMELEKVRKYIWNKNDADIIFYFPNEADKIEMLYAKYSPKVSNKDSALEVFSTTQIDLDTIKKIRRWKFDSGVFWLNYHSFIDKAKYKGIDKELVATLKGLKEQLNQLLPQFFLEVNKKNEVVQALIDRTLYIKYLEDNHIINSYFYSHYFNDDKLNYKKLLENNSNTDINKLFKIIHEIFNNALFDQPTIDDMYLTKEVRSLIANSFNQNINTGQLRLFDFRFDVLPVEFISYIYEVFLSEKQKENGIYYTPKKLAQLIVDDVIKEDKIGPIFDPSCGSGMFLTVGFQKLLETSKKLRIEPIDNIEKIKYRIRLLSENIFGIEKELTAQRFTFFSLSLQVFAGINPSEIESFIEKQLKENKKINLFSEYSFYQNIKHANTLDISHKPFGNQKFSYIIGNPPFFEISNTEEFQNEISFLNTYQVTVSDHTKKVARDVVGRSQISQCFLLKIKDWSHKNTRFGFVLNSSNFHNDYSETFQEYFYFYYGIEKIYELSRVKKILFEKAKESVVAIIFTNKFQDNTIEYYPVDLGLFSEKPFELLIIQEDKVIQIAQKQLLDKQIRLRDFLVGNNFDYNLYLKLNNQKKISDLILHTKGKHFIREGLKVVGQKAVSKEYEISKDEWSNLNRTKQLEYYEKFKKENISNTRTLEFPYKLLKPINIDNFRACKTSLFLREDISNFERGRDPEIFLGDKIIFNRTGSRIKALYSNQKIYFDFDIHVLKLNDKNLYYLITAILNSRLINYYIDLFFRKRIMGSYPKIGNNDILTLPVPEELNQGIIHQISDISKNLTDEKYKYSEKEQELNELIYDLYELTYWEKQRVKDYFLPKAKIGRKRNALEVYKNTLKEIMSFYSENPTTIKESSTGFNLIVVKISFANSSNNPKANKTKMYLLNEIFEQNPGANFLASQEKIFGIDCVYIIKEDINTNWTETKAFEDGQDILKHLIPNKNGEGIH